MNTYNNTSIGRFIGVQSKITPLIREAHKNISFKHVQIEVNSILEEIADLQSRGGH